MAPMAAACSSSRARLAGSGQRMSASILALGWTSASVRMVRSPEITPMSNSMAASAAGSVQAGLVSGKGSTMIEVRTPGSRLQISSVTKGVIGCMSLSTCSSTVSSTARAWSRAVGSSLNRSALIHSRYQSQNSCQTNW